MVEKSWQYKFMQPQIMNMKKDGGQFVQPKEPDLEPLQPKADGNILDEIKSQLLLFDKRTFKQCIVADGVD